MHVPYYCGNTEKENKNAFQQYETYFQGALFEQKKEEKKSTELTFQSKSKTFGLLPSVKLHVSLNTFDFVRAQLSRVLREQACPTRGLLVATTAEADTLSECEE